MAATNVRRKKKKQRTRVKRAGARPPETAGQLQLAPPEETDENIPVESVEEQLQRTAIRKVNSELDPIIKGLAAKAAQGNPAAARLLIEFMRGKKQLESKPAKTCPDSLSNLLRQYTTDGEWKDPDQPNSETAAGNG